MSEFLLPGMTDEAKLCMALRLTDDPENSGLDNDAWRTMVKWLLNNQLDLVVLWLAAGTAEMDTLTKQGKV
jgi:hypothetical protein